MTHKDTKFSSTNQPAIRNNGPAVAASNKKRKLITDATMLALHREVEDADGVMTKRINIIADKVVDKAIEGDIPAFKEVRDTVDGRPNQSIDTTLSNPDGSPIFMWGMGCPPKSE